MLGTCRQPQGPFSADAVHYPSTATPSSSHRQPHESQVHLYFEQEFSVAPVRSVLRPSKMTSVDWHLGQRTGISAGSSSYFRGGSLAGVYFSMPCLAQGRPICMIFTLTPLMQFEVTASTPVAFSGPMKNGIPARSSNV